MDLERDERFETSEDDQRQTILKALYESDGPMEVQDLYSYVKRTKRLKPGDYRGAEPLWQNRIRYSAIKLRKDGLLKSDTPKGHWEISNKGRIIFKNS